MIQTGKETRTQTDNITESRLQQLCFSWHWNNKPLERGRLWMQYNNPKNAAHGAVLKGMGMIPGPSDLAFLQDDGRMLFIELKLPGRRQSPAQKEWAATVRACGADYEIARSLEEFKNLFRSAI